MISNVHCADISWRHVCNSFSIYFFIDSSILRSENIIRREAKRKKTETKRNVSSNLSLLQCLIRITKEGAKEKQQTHMRIKNENPYGECAHVAWLCWLLCYARYSVVISPKFFFFSYGNVYKNAIASNEMIWDRVGSYANGIDMTTASSRTTQNSMTRDCVNSLMCIWLIP